MKHLIVAAHPSASSFTMALTQLYATELERLGHTQCTSDLYRMRFNPILGAEELTAADTGGVADLSARALPADLAQAPATCPGGRRAHGDLPALVAIDARHYEGVH